MRQKDGSVLVPVRAAGSEAWTPYDQAQIVGLKIMPDDLKRGATWPGDDDVRTDLAIGTGVERLTRSGLLSAAIARHMRSRSQMSSLPIAL